jgi:hypothetical protein
VGIDKARDPADVFDVVARQLGLDDVYFGLDHMLDAKRQVRHGDLFFDAIIHAIDVLVVIAGKMKHRLAKGFAGNCACIDTDSTNHFATLHQSHALAHFGPLDGRALARRSGSDNDKIVGLHRDTNLAHEGSKPHERESRTRVNRVKTADSPEIFTRDRRRWHLPVHVYGSNL